MNAIWLRMHHRVSACEKMNLNKRKKQGKVMIRERTNSCTFLYGRQASKQKSKKFVLYIYIYIYIYCKNCSLALHNIRKIRPFLTQHAAQLLDQALVISRLDYCNAQSIIWQHFHPTQSNLYRWFRMQQHDWSLANPKSQCYTSLYLPALAPGCSSHQVQDTDACI